MARTAHHLLAAAGPADADLLARFAAGRDAGAFELLVWRHAPLVVRVGRAVLRDRHAAEDCAQAVFLALARQAAAVNGDTLPGWLFRVTRRVAGRLARRSPRFAPADLDRLPAPPDSPADPAEVHALHDELARLPAAYRTPLLLCFFEGLTHAEAARRLGWPVGTVAGRVARGKAALAARLARRGLTPALLAAAVVAVPQAFAGTTTAAALAYVSGPGVPPTAATLATGELRRMLMTKTLRACGAVLACGAVSLGLAAGWGGAQPPQVVAPPPAPAPVPAPTPPKAFVGDWFAVAPVTTDLQRRLLGDKTPSPVAFMSIDGNQLFPEADRFDLDVLDLRAIGDATKKYQPTASRCIHIEVGYSQSPSPRPASRALVTYGLEGLIRRLGFGRADVLNQHGPEDWPKRVSPLWDEVGAASMETAAGDERVKTYPVLTPLSKMLAGPVYGVIDVRAPIDGRVNVPVPDGVDGAVRAALRGMRLAPGSKVNFLFNIVNRPPDGEDRFRPLVTGWVEAEGLTWGTYNVN